MMLTAATSKPSRAAGIARFSISPRLRGVLKIIEHDPAGNAHKPTNLVFGDKICRKVCDPK
jgi:hypothetical protein